VEAAVAAAVVAAAALHATWHALVKTSGDRVVALAGMNVVSGALALALMPFVKVPGPAVIAVIAVSVLLHGAYKLALATLYGRADLSRAYPLGRALTPIAALLLAYFVLGERPGSLTIAGVCAISAGIAGLVIERGAPRAPGRVVASAVVTGVAVAAYSLVDAYGVRLNEDWLGFAVWLVAWDAIAFVLYALATRGRAASRAWRGGWARTLVSGLLGVASFGVTMWALARAPVAAVSALRETSILFAALVMAGMVTIALAR
jgi:drug/metabolite transporter (DMT)-like permease